MEGERFPVYTRKVNTDVSYMACAPLLMDRREWIYPQFATYNAHTCAAVVAMAGNDKNSFEFQRLHGMCESLHALVKESEGTRCRIYAPVGAHRDLLAYLVRRLLENGANSSFVSQIVDTSIPSSDISRDPLDEMKRLGDEIASPNISRRAMLFRLRIPAGWWAKSMKPRQRRFPQPSTPHKAALTTGQGEWHRRP